METPLIKLSEKDVETVYEPSEDSFLLIDSLELDFQNIKKQKSLFFLEIGSGSGIVLTSLAMAYKKEKLPGYFVAVDINPDACRVTKNSSVINSMDLDVIQMDLVSAFKANHQFDIIIFNPPYVVTDSMEILDERLISKTWAGGKNGREVMDKLFPFLSKLLSSKGIFYLVAIKENIPGDIIRFFNELGMSGGIITDRKVRGEHLHILKFVKKTS